MHKPRRAGKMDTPVTIYDDEKIIRIREKISLVFGRTSAWDDATISERYNITPDGDLIVIVK
ncbi:MAG: hypothetical protein CVV30_05175 [Methanomicrobiales archaeon HGW-Methanomicrobiales-1]|nr:MAG: hypothetical protein CVV30_05175 [Methanomicrobiales archaeon HGW-Methanomicrobiales-1]